VLENARYQVIVADRGAAALALLERHSDVDLLLTDVVMPEMLGPELVAEASRRRPDLKVLYIGRRCARRSTPAPTTAACS